MQDIRPFVKWAWWKRWLISQLSKHFPTKIESYIEPFVWWWAVLIHILQTHKEVKSVYAFDINPNLINCYQVIKYNVEWLIKKLSKYQKEFWKIEDEWERKEYFLNLREKYNKKKLKKWEINIERAAQFIFLNRTCFNCLYRENSKWEFNVPFWKSSTKNPTICDTENLLWLSDLIQIVEFKQWNFYECEELAKKKTFVYFDPPYDPINKTSNFTDYNKWWFWDSDQERLAESFKILDKKWCNVMESNNNTKFIKQLYKWFKTKLVSAKRMINSDATKRWEIKEIVILSKNLK